MADKQETKQSAEKPETKQEQKPRRRSAPAQKKTKSEPLVYVGPNLRKGALSRFTIFRDDLPAHVTKLIENQTELKLLIVPASKLVDTLGRIEQAGTREASAYKKLKGSEN